MKTYQYSVTGITCGGCVNRVKNTLMPLAEHVEVTLNPPMVKLSNPTLGLAELNQALSLVGHYALIPNVDNQISPEVTEPPKTWLATYKPLILVFAYILLVCLLIEWANGNIEIHRLMPNFMAGFFLVFSFLKMLNLTGFASSYAMYDVLAKRMPSYGYIYPFIELGLGIAYLTNGHLFSVNLITFIVMAFSSLGVIIAVSNKQKIRCACLGAVFNLPMSTVTIIEDLLMAGMALYMIV